MNGNLQTMSMGQGRTEVIDRAIWQAMTDIGSQIGDGGLNDDNVKKVMNDLLDNDEAVREVLKANPNIKEGDSWQIAAQLYKKQFIAANGEDAWKASGMEDEMTHIGMSITNSMQASSGKDVNTLRQMYSVGTEQEYQRQQAASQATAALGKSFSGMFSDSFIERLSDNAAKASSEYIAARESGLSDEEAKKAAKVSGFDMIAQAVGALDLSPEASKAFADAKNLRSVIAKKTYELSQEKDPARKQQLKDEIRNLEGHYEAAVEKVKKEVSVKTKNLDENELAVKMGYDTRRGSHTTLQKAEDGTYKNVQLRDQDVKVDENGVVRVNYAGHGWQAKEDAVYTLSGTDKKGNEFRNVLTVDKDGNYYDHSTRKTITKEEMSEYIREGAIVKGGQMAIGPDGKPTAEYYYDDDGTLRHNVGGKSYIVRNAKGDAVKRGSEEDRVFSAFGAEALKDGAVMTESEAIEAFGTDDAKRKAAEEKLKKVKDAEDESESLDRIAEAALSVADSRYVDASAAGLVMDENGVKRLKGKVGVDEFNETFEKTKTAAEQALEDIAGLDDEKEIKKKLKAAGYSDDDVKTILDRKRIIAEERAGGSRGKKATDALEEQYKEDNKKLAKTVANAEAIRKQAEVVHEKNTNALNDKVWDKNKKTKHVVKRGKNKEGKDETPQEALERLKKELEGAKGVENQDKRRDLKNQIDELKANITAVENEQSADQLKKDESEAVQPKSDNETKKVSEGQGKKDASDKGYGFEQTAERKHKRYKDGWFWDNEVWMTDVEVKADEEKGITREGKKVKSDREAQKAEDAKKGVVNIHIDRAQFGPDGPEFKAHADNLRQKSGSDSPSTTVA